MTFSKLVKRILVFIQDGDPEKELVFFYILVKYFRYINNACDILHNKAREIATKKTTNKLRFSNCMSAPNILTCTS